MFCVVLSFAFCISLLAAKRTTEIFLKMLAGNLTNPTSTCQTQVLSKTHTHTPNTQCRWCKLFVEFKACQDVLSHAWNNKTDPILCPYFCLAATCLLGNDTRSGLGNLLPIKFKSPYMFGRILGQNAKNTTRKSVWATHATLVFQTFWNTNFHFLQNVLTCV